MKEKILEILNANLKGYQLVNNHDPILIAGTSQSSEEIDKLTKDHYLEFVEWFYEEYRECLTCQTNDDPLVYGFMSDKEKGTLEELYTYWKEKVTR